MKVYLLFNKYTKKFISFLSDIDLLPKDNFLIKEYSLEDLHITGENFNLARFRWEGDWDQGQLIDMFAEKKAIVTEEEVDLKYNGILFRKYRLEKLLFLILDKLSKLPEDASDSDDWKTLSSFFQRLMQKKNLEIKYFKESDNHFFDSKEQMDKDLKDSFTVPRKQKEEQYETMEFKK